jgi:hypothetical protein
MTPEPSRPNFGRLKQERAETLGMLEQGLKAGWRWTLRRMPPGRDVPLRPGILVRREAQRQYLIEDVLAEQVIAFEDMQTECLLNTIADWMWEREKETLMDDLKLSQAALGVLQVLSEAGRPMAKDELPSRQGHGRLLPALVEKQLIWQDDAGCYAITDDGVDELLKRKNQSKGNAMEARTTPPAQEPAPVAPPARIVVPRLAPPEPTDAPSAIIQALQSPMDAAGDAEVSELHMKARVLDFLMETSPSIRAVYEHMAGLDGAMRKLKALDE